MATTTLDFLQETIRDFENGGLNNEEFLLKAHRVYNSTVRVFSSDTLLKIEHPYLYGIIFSYLAKYYSHNIDYYTSIVENALCCLGRAMTESQTIYSKQCAAVRYLLLMDNNVSVLKGILRKFREHNSQEIYDQPLMMVNILAQGMDPWTHETDLLANLGQHCLNEFDGIQDISFLSNSEKLHYNSVVDSNNYYVAWPLIAIQPDQLFSLFDAFVKGIVQTPYERRITKLVYNWSNYAD